MSLFNREDAPSGAERQPEIPRVQIQGEEAVIPRADEADGGDRVPLPKKIWG